MQHRNLVNLFSQLLFYLQLNRITISVYSKIINITIRNERDVPTFKMNLRANVRIIRIACFGKIIFFKLE